MCAVYVFLLHEQICVTTTMIKIQNYPIHNDIPRTNLL